MTAFRAKYSVSQRRAYAEAKRNTYPDKVPVFLEALGARFADKAAPRLNKCKFCVSADDTFAQFVWFIRKHIRLPDSDALHWFVGAPDQRAQMPANHMLMSQVYAEGQDPDDQFLYVRYGRETTFGADGGEPHNDVVQVAQAVQASQAPLCLLAGRLWLGAREVSQNRAWGRQQGITHVVNCTTSELTQIPVAPHAQVLTLRLSNRPSLTPDQLDQTMSHACRFIDRALKHRGKVLLLGREGRSRGPAVAVAYLVRYLGMTSTHALTMVKHVQPVLEVTEAFGAHPCPA